MRKPLSRFIGSPRLVGVLFSQFSVGFPDDARQILTFAIVADPKWTDILSTTLVFSSAIG